MFKGVKKRGPNLKTAEQEVAANENLNLALAATAAKGAGSMSKNTEALLEKVLEKSLAKHEADEAQELAMAQTVARNSAVAAAQAEHENAQRQARCTHRNERGETRLGGQILSAAPTSVARIFYTCQACGKEWFIPRRTEKDPIVPQEIIPPARQIGGAVMTTGLEHQKIGTHSVSPETQFEFAVPAGA